MPKGIRWGGQDGGAGGRGAGALKLEGGRDAAEDGGPASVLGHAAHREPRVRGKVLQQLPHTGLYIILSYMNMM